MVSPLLQRGEPTAAPAARLQRDEPGGDAARQFLPGESQENKTNKKRPNQNDLKNPSRFHFPHSLISFSSWGCFTPLKASPGSRELAVAPTGNEAPAAASLPKPRFSPLFPVFPRIQTLRFFFFSLGLFPSPFIFFFLPELLLLRKTNLFPKRLEGGKKNPQIIYICTCRLLKRFPRPSRFTPGQRKIINTAKNKGGG